MAGCGGDNGGSNGGPTQADVDRAYDRGFDAGQKAGLKEGQDKGPSNRQVFNSGYDAGYKDGGADAFGVDVASWQTGVLYIVEVREGTGGLPYQIDTQYKMNPTEECVAQGTDVLCGPKD
jgi:hypothetical protein